MEVNTKKLLQLYLLDPSKLVLDPFWADREILAGRGYEIGSVGGYVILARV